MLQGSEHWWFEDRGPQCTLLVFIDDATSRLMHLRFVPTESAFDLLRPMPEGRALFGAGWADEARRMVALFRATHDLWAGDLAFASLIDRVHGGCPEFEAWWTAHDIGAAVAAGTKLLHHPARGRVRYEFATFQANDDPALKLAVYASADDQG